MSQGRIALVATYAAVAVVAVALPHAGLGQQPLTKEQRAEQFRERSVAAEKEGLASAFTGIATPAGLESGLFAIRSTGVVRSRAPAPSISAVRNRGESRACR